MQGGNANQLAFHSGQGAELEARVTHLYTRSKLEARATHLYTLCTIEARVTHLYTLSTIEARTGTTNLPSMVLHISHTFAL